MLGANVLPTRTFALASGGYMVQSLTPTTRSPRPSAKTHSATFGPMQMILRGAGSWGAPSAASRPGRTDGTPPTCASGSAIATPTAKAMTMTAMHRPRMSA